MPEPAQSVELRRAGPADVAAISACVNAAYTKWIPRVGRKPWPMMQDYAAIVADGMTHVASLEAELVGVLVLAISDEGFLIENVAVHPQHAGRGIGGRLLGFAEQQAKALGYGSVYLYTNELMSDNIALYAKRGYREYERRQEDGFRRVFMRKQLG